MLHGRCKNGESCPRSHAQLGQRDLNALWDAARVLYPKEFKDGGEQASASVPTGRLPICRFLNTRTGCHWDDKCKWPHNNSDAEQKRALKARADEAANGAQAPAATGLQDTSCDPDSTWTVPPEGTWVPHW